MGKGRGSGRSGDVDVNVKIETSEAFLLLLKSFLGSGTLSLPFAITHAGLMYGTTGFFILASFWCVVPRPPPRSPPSWPTPRLRPAPEPQRRRAVSSAVHLWRLSQPQAS